MKLALPLTLMTTLLGTASAQAPRPPVLVEDTLATAVSWPAIGTDGDLAVVAFGDGGTLANPDTIRVSTSDGRGLAWSASVRIDKGPSGTTRRMEEDGVKVVGEHVYVLWLDSRSGTQEAYLNRSMDGGVTWLGEDIVRNGFPGTTGETNGAILGVAADPLGGDDHVYVLMNTQDPTGTYSALFLAVAYDAGEHFGPAIHVPDFAVGSGPDVDELDLFVEAADAIHILWKDDRNASNDIWYRKFDGASLVGADARLNLAVGTVTWGTRIGLHARGGSVLAGWQNDVFGNGVVSWARSLDDGATWSGEAFIPGYAFGVDHASLGDVHITDDRLAVAIHQDSTGAYGATVATAPNAPAAIAPADWTNHDFATGGSALFPDLAGEGDVLAVSFRNSFGNHIQSAVSRDGGATFDPEVDVGFTAGGDDYQVMAYNALYGNALFAWLNDTAAATQRLYVGGYRPQTLTASLLAGGVQFEVQRFPAQETGDLYTILVAGGTGSVVLADGRNLGIAFPVLPVSVSLAFLSGVLPASGAGVIAVPVDTSLIPSGVFQCIALSIAGGSVGSITDVAPLL